VPPRDGQKTAVDNKTLIVEAQQPRSTKGNQQGAKKDTHSSTAPQKKPTTAKGQQRGYNPNTT
jgi:hypothetical protein